MDQQLLANAYKNGTIELKGRFTLGSNYTFLVTISGEGQEFSAVYKPQRGEQPLWDFPENTLAGREVAAYHIDQVLQWSLVPFTMFREDGPFGAGSLQAYIDYNPNYHYFSFKPADIQKLHPVALFDHITNNADRKGSHILFEKNTRHLYAIDHGLCFHTEDKLRTVIWDFAGEPISEAHLQSIRQIASPSDDLLQQLTPFLLDEEIMALTKRAENLLREAVYPQAPGDRRAFPYPPL